VGRWGAGADLVKPEWLERPITGSCGKVAATGEVVMPKFAEVLPWVANNKEALYTLAAFLAPVTSIIVGLVSYKAVVTGPRVQRRIAQEQAKLTERQLSLQEKQFRTTLHQLYFTVFGAVEQRWIDTFRDMLSEIFSISDRMALLEGVQQEGVIDEKQVDELIELRDEASKLISKVWLHLGHEGKEFVFKLRRWFFSIDEALNHEQYNKDVWFRRQIDVFNAAQEIMSERREKISFNQTPLAGDHPSASPSG
jgi:hypothetical protein